MPVEVPAKVVPGSGIPGTECMCDFRPPLPLWTSAGAGCIRGKAPADPHLVRERACGREGGRLEMVNREASACGWEAPKGAWGEFREDEPPPGLPFSAVPGPSSELRLGGPPTFT